MTTIPSRNGSNPFTRAALLILNTDPYCLRGRGGGGSAAEASLALIAGNLDRPGSANARFLLPQGVATDSAGNVYVADTNNHTIRQITPLGVVTTLAGTAGLRGSTEGADHVSSNPTGLETSLGIDIRAASVNVLRNTVSNMIACIAYAGIATGLFAGNTVTSCDTNFTGGTEGQQGNNFIPAP